MISFPPIDPMINLEYSSAIENAVEIATLEWDTMFENSVKRSRIIVLESLRLTNKSSGTGNSIWLRSYIWII